MATTIYMTNEANTQHSTAAVASIGTRGSTVRQSLGETVSDGLGGYIWNARSGPTWVFETPALNAVTISADASVNVWMKEGNMSANQGAYLLIEVVRGGSVVNSSTGSRGVELGTSFAAQAFTMGTVYTLQAGDKLRFSFGQTDVTTANGAYTGCDMTVGAGSSGVSGDTYVTFAETITENTGPATQSLTLGLLDAGAALYAPTLAPQPVTVTLGLLDGAAAVYAPTLAQVTPTQTVTLGLLDGSSALYAPTLVGKNTLTLGQIDATSALYAPSLTPKNTVTLGLLDAGPALYDVSLTLAPYPITLGLLDGGAALYAPTVSIAALAQTLTMPMLDALAVPL